LCGLNPRKIISKYVKEGILHVKWEVFNTTERVCSVDYIAMLTPFAGAVLFYGELLLPSFRVALRQASPGRRSKR